MDLVIMVMSMVAIMRVVVRLIAAAALAEQSPHQETQSRQDQHRADDLTLPGSDHLLEAQADEGYSARQRDRCDDVATGSQAADPPDPGQAPAL
jgi:hypothetical protein